MARHLSLFSTLISLLAVFSQSQPTSGTPKVLIFSRTVDFRHDSIPTAIEALKQQSAAHKIQFDNTEDQTLITDFNLSQYDALIFLHNTGQVLDDRGVAAFQNWVNAGGNFVGIHAASDSLRNNTFFQNEIGAHFRDHANFQNATVTVLNSSHPSTSMLPQRWAVQDEMYHFKSDPRATGAIVLLSADPSTFFDQTAPDSEEGSPSPKAWYQDQGAGASPGASGPIGRSWYTSLGHSNETWQASDSTFMAHIMGGITWALASNTTRAFNPNAKVGNLDVAPSNSVHSSSPAVTGQTSSPSPSQSVKPSAALKAQSGSFIILITVICIAAAGLFLLS